MYLRDPSGRQGHQTKSMPSTQVQNKRVRGTSQGKHLTRKIVWLQEDQSGATELGHNVQLPSTMQLSPAWKCNERLTVTHTLTRDSELYELGKREGQSRAALEGTSAWTVSWPRTP